MHAKQDTVDKVCGIVRKQLAPKYDILVTGESKFYSLGADSLDTVLHTFIGSFISGIFLSIVMISSLFCSILLYCSHSGNRKLLPYRPPELIGKLSDKKLRARNKGTSEEELELKTEYGSQFTNKLKGMF
ncbi:acyl carrier protein 1, chloroplastic-like protein [Tanacetum coccineum]